jgi:hypothetical protein
LEGSYAPIYDWHENAGVTRVTTTFALSTAISLCCFRLTLTLQVRDAMVWCVVRQRNVNFETGNEACRGGLTQNRPSPMLLSMPLYHKIPNMNHPQPKRNSKNINNHNNNDIAIFDAYCDGRNC